ncbi:MAG TPA: maltotransferase domain-containing protein, partial [Nitriliruptorales bacterium]|nr:maltotransferase domain-containing protein [Nitriliruptorales bacterium]
MTSTSVEDTVVAGNGRRPPSREGRSRVVICGVAPEIDAGRHPAKRTVGEQVVVEADVFTD